MSERYTKRDAEAAFNRLREALDRPRASDLAIDDPKREGALILDCNFTYGGYVVCEAAASSPPREGEDRPQTYTAESCPFGYTRRNTREFCEWVNTFLAGMEAGS